ncbi:MAG: leucyl aminopeptidase [Planctomycetes bacterium]|nr:leucyl aminopeptidase [Planctomycetota bacterium]
MPNNGTTFEFVAGGRKPTADVLIVPLAAKPRPAMQMLAKIDPLCSGAVSELVELGVLCDEIGQIAHTTRPAQFRRIILVSLGDDAELDPAKLRQAAAAATRWLIANKMKSAAVWIDGLLSCNFDAPVAEWVTGMSLAGFRFDELRKSENAAPANLRVQLLSSEPAHVAGSLDRIPSVQRVADAVNYARRLAHLPPNVFHPSSAVVEARRLARQHRLKCTVIDAKMAQRMGMGGLLAVGMASEHKPCLIRLDYRGAVAARSTTVVVGKTITFDTGGISIKPAAGMESMKFDKCGGCAVLGILKAVASLRLRCNVTGILAVAENVISDEAYRPSDIVRMMSGKTVEVTNTDAEGRMVLADALTYAQKHCRPTALIDFATLTGGVVTALGKCAAGLMSNNDDLAEHLVEAGRRTHERLWPLPLWDDYRELIKSTEGDIRNSSAKRYAHPIVGGIFLKEFVDKSVPWAHVDIAATATTDDEKTATGFGVRLIVEYLRHRSS